MGTPFLGELKIISWNYAPKGWALANGQFLPINQNQALFSLFGTTYGGNGQTTFALPNLRGRIPIGQFNGHNLGEAAGSETVTISQQTMPQHLHFLMGSSNTGNSQTASGNVLGVVAGRLYTDPAALTTLDPSSVTSVGGSQAHNNMQPFLTLNVIVALQGVFPSRN